MWAMTDDEGRICATTDVEEFAGGMEPFDFPEGFDFGSQSEWRIVDGELIHDPLPPTEEERAAAEEAERRAQLEAAVPMLVRAAAPSMADAQLLTIPLLFDEWRAGRDYQAGEVLRHDGVMYRVAQAHTSQSQWEPGAAGTEPLYTPAPIDPETGYDVWQRPTGAHDAYGKGDRVLWPDASGSVYESVIDGNVWAPDEYPEGWEVVSDGADG